MKLLELPPEVLQEVLKQTVITIGFQRAFRLRLVSKVFDCVTIHAIFTTRLIQEYPIGSSSALGAPLIAEYLEARTLADATSTNPLIAAIRQTSDMLLIEDKEGSKETWWTYVNALCKAATRNIGCSSVIKHLNASPGTACCQEAKPPDIIAGAAYLGQFSKVKDLIGPVSDAVRLSDYFGNSKVLAAAGGHEHILVMLLEHGTDFSYGELTSHYKQWHALGSREIGMALQTASLAGHNHIVRVLLERQYLDGSGYDYEAALLNAAREGHSSIVQILLDKSTSQDAIFLNERILSEASGGGHVNIVRMMLDLGTDVNAENSPGGKPIHRAGARGHHKVIKLLLARGAEQETSTRETPLDEAVRRGFIQATQVLIDHGANLNAWYLWCHAPLPWAAGQGHSHMVQLLIDKGADLRMKKSGSMALYSAVARGYESVVRILVEAGVDVDGAEDADSPLLNAIIEGQDHVARYLVKVGASRVEPSKSELAQKSARFLSDGCFSKGHQGLQKAVERSYDEVMSAWQGLTQSLFS